MSSDATIATKEDLPTTPTTQRRGALEYLTQIQMHLDGVSMYVPLQTMEAIVLNAKWIKDELESLYKSRDRKVELEIEQKSLKEVIHGTKETPGCMGCAQKISIIQAMKTKMTERVNDYGQAYNEQIRVSKILETKIERLEQRLSELEAERTKGPGSFYGWNPELGYWKSDN